jgi:hypothetical protein
MQGKKRLLSILWKITYSGSFLLVTEILCGFSLVFGGAKLIQFFVLWRFGTFVVYVDISELAPLFHRFYRPS